MRWPIILLLSIAFLQVNAQRFAGNPSSVRWSQVNTDTVRVIFQQGYDSIAKRIASLTHKMQRTYSNSIGNQLRKINIVLQNDIAYSNAYVGLAPYRSEFYLMPPQSPFALGAQSWADNLAIHEYRHVQQYSNFKRGWSKVAAVFFGQEGQAVANAAAVPDWFFEGDAVFNETLLSQQGRGRLPIFFSGYRSLFNEHISYGYDKLRNGSLRNYVPNHYQLGYLLVAYGRKTYGADFWQKVTADAAAYKPLFYPLQGAVKKHAGISYPVFVQNTFDYFHRQWKQDSVRLQEFSRMENAFARKNYAVNYQYPYPANDGKVLFLKTSQQDIPAFVLMDSSGKETRIAVRDIAYDDYYAYNNGKIIYAILQPDRRWGNREYSRIKIKDIHTGQENTISGRSKYFSPDISHNGKTIVAVNMQPGQPSSLVLLNSDGTGEKQLLSSSSLVYAYPKFAEDDHSIFFFARDAKGFMSLQKLSISNGKTDTLIPFSNTIMGFPVVQKDTLCFTITAEDRDELWAFVGSEKKSYQLASYPTGLYQGFINVPGSVVASAFTATGYKPVTTKPIWQPAEPVPLATLYIDAANDKTANGLLQQSLDTSFTVSRYSKAFRLFNFQSWRPYYDQPEYSFSVYSQNMLNTLQSRAYYVFNSNERSSKAGFTAVYGGWYLQPLIDLNHTWHRTGNYRDSLDVHWNEWSTAAGLQLPLNFSSGRHYTYLTLASTYNYRQVNWTGTGKQLFDDTHLTYLDSRISFSSQIQKAPMQIYPRLAQNIQLRYRNIVTNSQGYQLLARGSFYFPGLAKTHSLVIHTAYQRRDTAGQYFFSNDFPFSRGYRVYDFPRMWMASANYHFPIWFPDKGFGNIIYFQRIRLNAFFDYTNVKSLRTQSDFQFKTVGAEIFFDTKWWNQQPVTVGLRYSRLLNATLTGQNANQWEVVLPVGLLN